MNERAACERVCSALQKTGFVAPLNSPSKPSGFTIKHFAGPVDYTSAGLLLKNKDQIPNEVVTLLEKSDNKFIYKIIFGLEEKESVKNGRNSRKITTLLKFKGSLDSLMKTMTACDLHYIRCIKPNASGYPGAPDKELLLNQLRSNGILDTVKISQVGYSMRMLYGDFVQRYCTEDANFNDKEKTFITCLKVFGDGGKGHPDESNCRFGCTRLFLSEGGLRELEKLRFEKREFAAATIQKNYKRFKTQLLYRKILLSVQIIQNAVRSFLTFKKYRKICSSIICIQKNVKMILHRKKYLKMRNSAMTIQKYAKSWLERLKTESVCPSRLSVVSGGYSSMASAPYTDYSNSDVETISMSHDLLLTSRRLIETEESGIETDTESLSGVKSGKAAKHKNRRHSQRTTSDHHVTNYTNLNQSMENLKLNKSCDTATMNQPTTERRLKKGSTSGLHKWRQPPVVLNYFTEISNMLKTCGPTEVIQLYLPIRNQLVFYKDGVVSCHRLSKVTSIKFHTRQTCLPFSTCKPMHECPQGIIDALN